MNIPNELTLAEKEAIAELKKRIGDEVPSHLKNDAYLYLRFLRARDFNLKVSEDMLRAHLNWRKANNIDNILKDFDCPEIKGQTEKSDRKIKKQSVGSETKNSRIWIVTKYLPLTRIGYDKDGCPIRYFAFGNMDAKGILKCVKRQECVLGAIQQFEEDVVMLKRKTEEFGKPVEQWVYILNFEHYTFAKATHKQTLEALIALFMQYEANYPERLKAAYIINASVYFTLAYAIIKPLLSGNTLRKISIYGKDGWKDALASNTDLEVLPVFLGGKKTDPDGNPLCHTFVKHGELVPEDLYSSRNTNRLSKQPGVKKLTVSRMSKVHINLDVAESGSLIEWEFELENKDIEFSLLYNTSNDSSSMKDLVPKQRIDTHIASETGMYQCERPGNYVLVFDNSYSWLHQKEIYCKVALITPKGERVPVLQ